ncbi:putative High-affinity glucose transporter RGT2 [Glarea lozoyensis 74030]|uniref:Putative High-affinity glucose transporter RGT2 n=1 Tax=Glarea lozoyensis (strain ATCC 74030 / MF5533) TaxID=1104152 RepID=H0EFP0_GLAL7|nr:putative High-affinity glucose transporter RGT2 [Glarea lozoyensis 74030]
MVVSSQEAPHPYKTKLVKMHKVFGFRAPKTPSGWNLTTERQQLISSLMTLGAFGTLIGTIIDYATAKNLGKSAYLIPLGIIYVVPAVMSIALFFIPESPRWLLLQGKREEGVKSLARLRPDGTDVEDEAAIIVAAIERERELSRGVGVVDLFRNPIDRRRTIIAVCGVTTQAATGSMFIIAYKAYFFTMAKVSNPFGMSCVLSTLGLLALAINSLIVVRYGRRRVLLMSGLVTCGILQLIIAITYHKNPGTKKTGKVLVALSCLYMMSYNGMVSPYAWLTGGEIPSQRLRSYTFGLSAAIGFFFAWLTQFTAPYFINPLSLNWGPRYGFIWFPSAIITAVWVFFFLPEVKGRKLEEVDEMFEAKLGARKFEEYVCVGPLRLSEEKLNEIEEEKEVHSEEKKAFQKQVKPEVYLAEWFEFLMVDEKESEEAQQRARMCLKVLVEQIRFPATDDASQRLRKPKDILGLLA